MEDREIRREKRMRNGQHVRCELLVETGENECLSADHVGNSWWQERQKGEGP